MKIFGYNFDSYDYKARVCPALLAMLVPLIVTLLIVPAFLSKYQYLLSVIIAFGGLMLLSALTREWGKLKETQLFHMWGGSPTTLLLLRSTNLLDCITLNRYYKVIESNIPGLKFFDEIKENMDQQGASAICESAVRWLRVVTRDSKKYPLVFSENVNYGFRRNLFGVRPLAIVLCLLSLISLMIHAWIITAGQISMVAVDLWAAMGISVAALWFWYFIVNERFVKTAAFAYAMALLSSCDSLLLIKEKRKS